MATSFTVPTGVSNVLVLFQAGDYYNGGSTGYATIDAWLDTVGTGTIWGSCQFNPGGQASTQAPAMIMAVVPVTAGSHTMKFSAKTSAGTFALEISGSRPVNIVVLALS